MAFTLQKSEYRGYPRLALSGTLMDIDVYWFSRETKALLKENHALVIIDVTHCEFIDSHGLGVLVFHHQQMAQEQKKMIILNENPDPGAYISGLFQTSGLNRILNIVNSSPGQ